MHITNKNQLVNSCKRKQNYFLAFYQMVNADEQLLSLALQTTYFPLKITLFRKFCTLHYFGHLTVYIMTNFQNGFKNS